MPDVLPARVRHGGLSPLDVVLRTAAAGSSSCDLVHGFDHRPAVSIPALFTRGRRRVLYVADWADLWGRGGIADERAGGFGAVLGEFDHYWERRVHRRPDAATVATRDLAERAAALGVPRARIRRIGVGASSDVIRPLERAAMRQRYGLSWDAPIVVHAGFAPYDARLLGETLVASSRRNPRLRFVLTGAPLRDVTAAAAAAGISDRVHHFGIVPDERLGEVLACGDVMLLPFTSRSINIARFPNRLGDYLAAGRAVVGNRTGDLGELIETEGVGVLADEDPESLAGAIERLLTDDAGRKEMEVRARTLAETRMSWDAIARDVDDLYRELTGG